MPQNSTVKDDEIDLRELFGVLWFHKVFIVSVTILSIFCAGYMVLTAERKFTASAIFHIEKVDSGSGLSLSGELGVLASIAGFNNGSRSSNLNDLFERATGREFINQMKEKFLIESDPYFNSFDPEYKYEDPFWKSIIKQIVGWQSTELEKEAIIEKTIIDSYRENVKFERTDNGAISISVTHIDPEKASRYANDFMEAIKRLVEHESKTAQELRLNYLSETLADALQEMEEAQESLKNYALKNSALAQENFLTDSLQLDEFRMERRKVTEFTDLLSIMKNIIKSGKLDRSSYEALRSNHPLVDDIDFRRILGMSETVSAWVWPEIDAIDAVSTALRDRIKRLDIDIENIEENATIYATSAEDYTRLTRDAKIAEATYTVLIEQVKSQSLAAGFQSETFKVYEYATPPLAPSSPNRFRALAIGTALGILIGCILSLINGIRRGVYYTKSALKVDANADLALKSKSIKRLSRKSLSQTISSISKRIIVELDEAVLKLASKKIIYVMNPGGRISSFSGAQLLAMNSAQSGRNVVICDTTGQTEKQLKDSLKQNGSNLPTIKIGENISVLKETDEASFFTSKNFNSTIKELTSRFDQVFICSSKRNGYTGLMALSDFDPGLVIISSLRRTKKIDIKNIKSSHPIDILFHD